VRALIVAIFITAIAAPALAQPERLPAQSRSEQQIQDINRSLAVQQRELRQEQQTQFEINQLRGEIRRESMFGSPGRCAPGAISC
jgi:TolA-binding protein